MIFHRKPAVYPSHEGFITLLISKSYHILYSWLLKLSIKSLFDSALHINIKT
jgi:hypothetical protein